MVKGAVVGALALAASVMAVTATIGGGNAARPVRYAVGPTRAPASGPSMGRVKTGGGAVRAQAAPPAAGVRQFQFRSLVFAVPVSWTVRRADELPFQYRYAIGPGGITGPQLTFSDTVRFVGPGTAGRSRTGLGVQRYEMPNAGTRGIVYVFPEAGVSVSAQVRTETEARAVDAVIESARPALPQRPAARS